MNVGASLVGGSPSRRTAFALTIAAVGAPVVLLPLLIAPKMGIAAAIAAMAGLLVWVSPAFPLGLMHSGELIPLAQVEAPAGATTIALFAWLFGGVGLAVLRRRDGLPERLVYLLPALLSLGLFAVMILRLPGSPAAQYGSDKTQLFLTVNIAVLLTGIVVGRRRRDVELCLVLMLGVAFIAAVATLLQILSGVQPNFEGRYAVSNQDYDPIALGRISASGLLIALYAVLGGRARVRTAAIVIAPVLTVAFLASGGRGPVVGLILGLVVLLGLSTSGASAARRRVPVVVGAVLLSVAVASQLVPGDAMARTASLIIGGESGRDANGRSELWSAAWRAFTDHPWSGVGTGGFAAIRPDVIYPHNLLLETAAEWGLIGLVPLVATLTVGIGALGQAVRRLSEPARGLSVVVAALFTAALANALFSTDITHNSDVWLTLGLGVGLASRASSVQTPTRLSGA